MSAWTKKAESRVVTSVNEIGAADIRTTLAAGDPPTSIETWKSNRNSIEYWLVWVALGAWAIRCDKLYVLSGWWMVLLAFWLTANAFKPPYLLPSRLKIVCLPLVTMAAAFFVYGTFAWLLEIADGWTMGRPGQWLRVVAIPVRVVVSAFFSALLLVPLLRRQIKPFSGTVLTVVGLLAGLTEYGSDLGSLAHWRQRGLASCIELFCVIIFPLVLVAVDRRLETIRWPRWRFASAIASLWRGEVPTWVALLIVYPMTAIGVFWLLTRQLGDRGYSDWELANRMAAEWMGLLLLLVMGSVVTWRCLNRRGEKRRRSTRWLQGGIALIAAPFLLITLFGKGFEVGHVFVESAKVALGNAYELRVSNPGNEVSFTGEVTYGLADRLEEELEAHLGVSRIRLESNGGQLEEAVRAAKVISAHKLDTVVGDSCVSACTIMFIAGKERTLDKDAKLGFHAARSQDPTEGVTGGAGATLIPFGVAKGFIARVDATAPAAMWYPTREELKAAGVLSK